MWRAHRQPAAALLQTWLRPRRSRAGDDNANTEHPPPTGPEAQACAGARAAFLGWIAGCLQYVGIEVSFPST